jgi:NitT/TauT family transport system permease protein
VFDALSITMMITGAALLVAIIGGAGLAILFKQSRLMEMSLYPYAVILQVTPIVSIAPLIFIYVEERLVGLLLCAWIVAFFPILSNTTLGLKSADHNLRDLFTIYGATRWQRLLHLQLPSALPYFLGGLRIAGGLALIGAVVAEYVAGTGGIGSGLAFTHPGSWLPAQHPAHVRGPLPDRGNRRGDLRHARFVSLLLHKWHESALKRER